MESSKVWLEEKPPNVHNNPLPPTSCSYTWIKIISRHPCPVLKVGYWIQCNYCYCKAIMLQIQYRVTHCFLVLKWIWRQVVVLLAAYSDHVEAAMILSSIQMGEILLYDKHFMVKKVCNYICLLYLNHIIDGNIINTIINNLGVVNIIAFFATITFIAVIVIIITLL